MPDLNHLWQRFLLASSLLVGLAIGAAVTIFGYSNLSTVDVRWSVFHVDGVPLWTVAVVPIVLVLVVGTVYHWTDNFHHFTEHMRHRRLVHELEAEVASLRAHLDHVLEMPDQSSSKLPRKPTTTEPDVESPAPALPAPELDAAMLATGGDVRKASRSKRPTLAVEPAAPAAATTNGGTESTTPEPSPEATTEA